MAKRKIEAAARFCTSSDGTRLAYDVNGDGPALMLLHGAGLTRLDWHETGYVDRLKDKFTVITMDARGSGESVRPFEIGDYVVERMVEDVLAVADAVGPARFAIWGFSFGGNIGRYVAAWTDRVSALAVIGVPLGEAMSNEFDRRVEAMVKKWGPLVDAHRQGRLAEVPEADRGPVRDGTIAVWLACFQAMRAWPNIGPETLRCPALLVSGTQNRVMVDWLAANRQALDAAGVRVETIEGLSHDQEFTDVDRVLPVVSQFFRNPEVVR